MQIKIDVLAFFAAQVATVAATANPAPSAAISWTQPVPLFDLVNAFPGSDRVTDPFDVEAIRSVMAHYPLAIDGKNFDGLKRVFATTAVANYSAPLGVLTPLSSIESALKTSLARVTTQHSLGTQVIDVLSPVSAVSVTYYTATHFGTGAYAGEIATAYGQYQDVWSRQRDLSWRITHRNLVYMGGIIGNLSIFG